MLLTHNLDDFPMRDLRVQLPEHDAPAPAPEYVDVPGLCRVATLAEIEAQGWNLNPGRYTNAQHAYVGHRLAIVLDPYARAAGLAGTDPFNLGEPEDYRVPDRGYHRGAPSGVWVATAAIVVEIVSLDDET